MWYERVAKLRAERAESSWMAYWWVVGGLGVARRVEVMRRVRVRAART